MPKRAMAVRDYVEVDGPCRIRLAGIHLRARADLEFECAPEVKVSAVNVPIRAVDPKLVAKLGLKR